MARDERAPRVFNIPAGVPFLPTLAEALLNGQFGGIPGLGDDPLALADVTILLPTRRAVRALADLFAERGGGRTAVLPTIRPIGDVDEEDLLLAPADDGETAGAQLLLPAAIPRLERQLILTRLALAWGRSGRDAVDAGDGRPQLPAAPAEAFHLATDLARLIDEIETQGIDRAALATLVPDDYARYWQVTLDFLRILTEHWPAILAERRLADPAARRNLFIDARAAQLARQQPTAPVIAAGSTGSIPATARLLSVIARLPAGAVVLPGLDTDLDADGWAAIGTDANGAPSHPQFGLKHLLGVIGLDRCDVQSLAEAPTSRAARSRAFSEAMRPAETTDRWAAHPQLAPEALAGLALAVAANEQEEAVTIALALREAVEAPGATAALVTPDRDLARRVAVELRRWRLEIDDSAGTPLADTPAGIFARLMTQAAAVEPEPAAILALLKHPLAAFGLDRPLCRQAARTLELAVYRGMRPVGGLSGLGETLAAALAGTTGQRRHPALARLTEEDGAAAAALVRRLVATLQPLVGLAARGGTATAIAAALATAVDAASTDASGSAAVHSAEGGEELGLLLAGMSGADADALTLAGPEIPEFLTAAMGGALVPGRPSADPRIHVWGTLEARLQSVGLMVVAGLDEGVWPAPTRTDAWLSRGMRAAIGLDPPERRTGLSAHDFVEAASAPAVLLTRAEKRGGTPTVASRWLQRLTALAGEARTRALTDAGNRILAWARRLDRVPAADVQPAARPEPRPPVAARPRRLSVTEIETLVRDPYAIYARRILRLEPLDPVGRAPDYALRGTLIHDALNLFTKGWRPDLDEAGAAALYAAAERPFDRLAGFVDLRLMWWLRFRQVGQWFLAWERDRDAAIASRHAEISGEWEVAAPAGPFRLRGRADRIDLRHDGGIEILDYKTGEPPTARQVLTGFAPQLALEAAMARAGAFGPQFAGRTVAALAWLAVGRAGRREPLETAIEKERTGDEMASIAAAQLATLIARFDVADTAYLSVARPMFVRRFAGDFDHLARLGEWSLTGTEDDA